LGQAPSEQAPQIDGHAVTVDVKAAYDRLRSGEVSPVDLENLAAGKERSAIPLLVSAYAQQHDSFIKAKIASTLIRLGDQDKLYFEMLTQSVEGLLEENEPAPFTYDRTGHLEASMPAVFGQWAASHNLTPEDAAERFLYDAPGVVSMLAETKDPRARATLLLALRSVNPYIRTNAALGLAQLKDRSAIKAIILSSESAQPEFRSLVAEALVYFDDPEAADAARRLIPVERLNALKADRAQGPPALK
jgi:HEAT repeat protein